MGEYPQGPAVGQQPVGQQGRRFQGALDPRSYDPRKVVDQQHMQEQMRKLARAQAVARARAQATSTVFLATTVSLATSAFGVVAALAWNDAINAVLSDAVKNNPAIARLGPTATQVLYAVFVTVIAVIVILTLNRVASRIARRSAIDAAEADSGSL
jgi:Family of unknown function (DUF5654)